MRKQFILLIFALSTLSCNEQKQKEKKTDSLPGNETNWGDSLVTKYINQTEDTTVKLARQDTIPIEWMLDRIEKSDTAIYFVFHIGHTFENRFVTDKWLYIDSLTKSIYEYDLINDRLIKWLK